MILPELELGVPGELAHTNPNLQLSTSRKPGNTELQLGNTSPKPGNPERLLGTTCGRAKIRIVACLPFVSGTCRLYTAMRDISASGLE